MVHAQQTASARYAQEPLDGVLGFSQGANMASLLAAQAIAGQGTSQADCVCQTARGPSWVVLH